MEYIDEPQTKTKMMRRRTPMPLLLLASIILIVSQTNLIQPSICDVLAFQPSPTSTQPRIQHLQKQQQTKSSAAQTTRHPSWGVRNIARESSSTLCGAYIINDNGVVPNACASTGGTTSMTSLSTSSLSSVVTTIKPTTKVNWDCVFKFGGSSLANADRIDHVANLIKDQMTNDGVRPRVVVCSAMGKTTNTLLQAGQEALAMAATTTTRSTTTTISRGWYFIVSHEN
jgi:hypothetical protein